MKTYTAIYQANARAQIVNEFEMLGFTGREQNAAVDAMMTAGADGVLAFDADGVLTFDGASIRTAIQKRAGELVDGSQAAFTAGKVSRAALKLLTQSGQQATRPEIFNARIPTGTTREQLRSGNF